MPREKSPYYEALKKSREDAEIRAYWKRFEERWEDEKAQEEIKASMRAQAINDAPPQESFEEQLASDLREDLDEALNLIDESITFYLEDESPVTLKQMVTLRKLLVSALDLHEQLN